MTFKETIRNIFEEAEPKAERKLKSIADSNPEILGKAIIFNIRDKGDVVAVIMGGPDGTKPIYTEDKSDLEEHDDAAVINLTEEGAKKILTGRLTPNEARYRERGEEGKPMLYITDVTGDTKARKLTIPKQVFWIWCQLFFEFLSEVVLDKINQTMEE